MRYIHNTPKREMSTVSLHRLGRRRIERFGKKENEERTSFFPPFFQANLE